MSDPQIHHTIDELIAEEARLRAQLGAGEISENEEHTRLRQVETELDQCWDLLRQRDAKREFGENPDDAHLRPAAVVENYEG